MNSRIKHDLKWFGSGFFGGHALAWFVFALSNQPWRCSPPVSVTFAIGTVLGIVLGVFLKVLSERYR